MNKEIKNREIVGQALGALLAIIAVTTASYAWRIPQAYGSQAVLVTYGISAALLIAGAFFIFRRVVPRDYEKARQLTALPAFLQLLIWGMFFAFPCIYNPYDWAWSRSGTSRAIPALGSIGWVCVGIGLGVVIGSLTWLGLSRSTGQNGKKLEQDGPYRLTRNPQLVGGMLIISGYVVLSPSWYALGWMALYVSMAHMMVLAEEKHLHTIHGEAYSEYCQRIPRYFGLVRKST